MASARALIVALPLAVAVLGCGSSPEAVRVDVDVERARTGHEAFGFTGRVSPAGSTVTVALAGGAAGPVVVEPSGRFSAAVGGLRRGANVVRLRATRPGFEPWREELRVVRDAAPPRVRVPERDTSPPVALLRLGPARRAAGVLTVSPSAPRDRPRTVILPRPEFHATAFVRDDGGAGRIRLSTTYSTRCGGRVRPTHRSLPPAQIQNVRLAPGTRIEAEETRTATMRLRAGPGCTVSGQAWAEATDGHGLQAVSRHVAFRYP